MDQLKVTDKQAAKESRSGSISRRATRERSPSGMPPSRPKMAAKPEIAMPTELTRKRSDSWRKVYNKVLTPTKMSTKSKTSPMLKLVLDATKAKKKRLLKEPSRFVEFLTKQKTDSLRETAKQLMRPGLGIFAVDDSERQLGERLRAINLTNTEKNRQRYHELLFDAEVGDRDMNECFSGVLMRQEHFAVLPSRNKKIINLIRDRNLLLGVRFDTRVERLPGTDREYGTAEEARLEERIKMLRDKHVSFGLWRCVYRVSHSTPSTLALLHNSRSMARFASTLQHWGLVPIISAETLLEGTHDYDEAKEALKMILASLVKTLADYHVYLAGMLLRVSAAFPGECFKGKRDLEVVASNTIGTLNQCLPPAIGGVLLARGEDLASSVTVLHNIQNCPIRKAFFITFCFSRVIQEGVVELWAGQDKNVNKAKLELMRRAKLCSLASMGCYNAKSNGCFFVTVLFPY